MGNSQVLVVGSANYDLVFRSERLASPGETVLGDSFETHPGGKGANQAVAIGRLAGRVALAGCVGSDSYGEALLESLRDANVSTELVEVKAELPTGTAGIFVDSSGTNSIVVVAGANSLVSGEQVALALERDRAKVVLAQLEIPLDAVMAAAKAELFILNPAPARNLPDEIYAQCYAITPNETEFETLTGISGQSEDGLLAGSRKLLDKGALNVIVTRGSKGCFWASEVGRGSFMAPSVEVVDTTAAGDAFNGALALFVAEGRSIENSIALANCVGALSVTARGAQESMPSVGALKALAGDLY